MQPPWRQVTGGVELSVTLTPGAAANRVLGIADGRLRLAVTARAHDNLANKALLKFLAGWLDVPASALGIRHGATARRKLVVVSGAGPDLLARLQRETGLTQIAT